MLYQFGTEKESSERQNHRALYKLELRFVGPSRGTRGGNRSYWIQGEPTYAHVPWEKDFITGSSSVRQPTTTPVSEFAQVLH